MYLIHKDDYIPDMPLVSSSIPNLINGISQQPAEIRLPSQAERQINGLSSVARGLEKRPGTEHKAKLSTSTESDFFIHSIRRDSSEEYTMTLSRTSGGVKDLKVYDQNGNSIPVLHDTVSDASAATIVNGTHASVVVDADLAYLEVSDTGGVKDNIKATTVADTTFLINKTTTIEKASTNAQASGEGTTGSAQHISSRGSDNLVSTWANGYEGLIYVKNGDYSSKYVVTLKPTSGTLNG